MQRCLACRVSCTDQKDVQSMGGVRLAARGSIIDTLADKPVETVDGEATPCHACCKNEAPRPDSIGAVEKHLMRRRVDAGDGAGHQDFGSQPPRLLERATGEFVARNSARKPEIVLDPRRRTRLSARRLAL